MATTATFYIAERLRGIPLVTHGKQNGRHEKEQIVPSSTTNAPAKVMGDVKIELKPLQTLQVGKRHADTRRHNARTLTTSSDLSLLFEPSAMTASTANLVRSKPTSTTTTRRPPITTTRKWKTVTNKIKAPVRKATTATTTKAPKSAQFAKPIESTTPSPSKVTTTVAPAATTTTTVTTTETTAPPPTTTTTHALLQSTEPRVMLSTMMMSKPTTIAMMSSDGHKFDRHQVTSTTAASVSVPNLARATQTLTTNPVNQRRTQQTVSLPRYTSKPAEGTMRSAGENWVLFNRQDGGMSMFEVLVLLSNIMIVSTIIFVILMSWMKSIKKKRSARSDEPKSGQRRSLTQANRDTSPGQASRSLSSQPTEDKGGRISMLSSVSNITSVTSAESPQQQSPLRALRQNPEASGTSFGVKNEASAANVVKSNLNDLEANVANASRQLIGTTQNITSEFKTGAMNVANKAMAIVQPTENNAPTESGACSDSDKPSNSLKDELIGQAHTTISRSISDLSGSAKQRKNSIIPPEAGDVTARPTILDDLFNGSTPNLGALSTTYKSIPKQGDQKGSKNPPSKPLAHASSLDSIELPGELVATIKRSAPAKAEVPSPNLLLGGVDKPEVKKETGINNQIKNAGVKEMSTPKSKEDESKSQQEALEKKNIDALADKMAATIANKDSGEKSKQEKLDQSKTLASETTIENQLETNRPPNPMGTIAEVSKSNDTKKPTNKKDNKNEPQSDSQVATQIKNHQLVVNKLDKRKTNLEIVDLRDESVTGKMRNGVSEGEANAKAGPTGDTGGWISMDGLAVVQPVTTIPANVAQQSQSSAQSPTLQNQVMSPSEIIESRFHVDYSGRRRGAKQASDTTGKQQESMDSKQEEYLMSNIENELEQDNKMKNRKYFVYIVHDGHFTAKKECIARIELPPKRRITLAELRQLIASSQDISLSSLRRNRFKFVTETYRLLNENEDAAVLHQVYPTQGVFLKLNIPEQENQVYPYKGRGNRLSSGGTTPSSLSHTTISSRRRATTRTGQPRSTREDSMLPAIEVEHSYGSETARTGYGRTRALSSGRRTTTTTTTTNQSAGGTFRRSKSSVQTGRRANLRNPVDGASADRLPVIGRSTNGLSNKRGSSSSRGSQSTLAAQRRPVRRGDNKRRTPQKQTLSSAATDLGSNVLSGAKRLLNTFHL